MATYKQVHEQVQTHTIRAYIHYKVVKRKVIKRRCIGLVA
jgi:hypothetical protein